MSTNNLGLMKKSFSIFYNNGSIWIEHLDSINNELALKNKFLEDIKQINRPSTSSYIAVVLTETEVNKEVLSLIIDTFCNCSKQLQKVVFIGLNHKMKKYLKRKSTTLNFITESINDLEKAKEWLLGKV